MKVFEVLFEYCEGDSKEILTERNFWTAPNLLLVSNVASMHAFQYEKELVGVREVLTITQQLTQEDWSDVMPADMED